VGAGREPVAQHPPRPPIPMRPLDAAAMAAARARRPRPPGALGRLEELASWLAGVTGAERPSVRARLVVAGGDLALAGRVEADVVVADAGLGPSRDVTQGPALSVGEVAAAVDAGRDLAGRAAADGVTVLAAGASAAASTGTTGLSAVLTGHDPEALVEPGARHAGEREAVVRAHGLHAADARGPLGALRRLGGADVAVLCGLALGAGEHGLGVVADGLIPLAGAAVAVAVEPGLRPRLLAADRAVGPAHAALLAHLDLEPVVDLGVRAGDGAGALAAIAVLRVAAALAG
jgi:nicotinate-nucleotide--dimethylbenzimidazole phosphoribosyltransferase